MTSSHHRFREGTETSSFCLMSCIILDAKKSRNAIIHMLEFPFHHYL